MEKWSVIANFCWLLLACYAVVASLTGCSISSSQSLTKTKACVDIGVHIDQNFLDAVSRIQRVTVPEKAKNPAESDGIE